MSVHAVLARRRAERLATLTRAVDFHESLRLGLLTASLALAVVSHELGRTLPWLAALALIAVIPVWWPKSSLPAMAWAAIELAVAWSGTLVLSAAEPNPLLVYLVAPALAVAVCGGARAVLALALLEALVPLTLAGTGLDVPAGQVGVQALALSVAAAGLGLWAADLRRPMPTDADLDQYEAQRLLTQVHALVRRLPGGFDLASVAGSLVERLRDGHPVDRVAVLVGHSPDALTPVTLTGWDQLPPLPVEVDGQLGRAWATGTCQWRRVDDELVAVLPLRVGDGVGVGVAVLAWAGAGSPSPQEQQQLVRDCAPAALALETAQLFDQVRLAGLVEARESLAAQMHNGIAQDLAYIGFELDGLKAATRGTQLHDDVASLRSHVTDLVQDLRLSISDLRSTIGPGQPLSAALSSQVRHVAGTRGVPVSFDLRESALRLAAPVEQLLYRLAIVGAQAARREPGVRALHVALSTTPPSATLTVRITGASLGEKCFGDELVEVASALAEHSGVVSVQVDGHAAITLRATVGGGTT
ncbi:MAG: hypothetical protein ACTHQ3_07320 [Motilibacteraceae bacterium]